MLRKILPLCLLAYLFFTIPSCKKDALIDSVDGHSDRLDVGHSRSLKSRCLTDRQMERIYQNQTQYRREVLQGRMETMIKMENDKSRALTELDLITVPIHFIVVYKPGQNIGVGANISRARIESQLAVLNRDFLRKNPDAVNTPAIFAVSSSQIQFCLANRDPNGAATDGITRYATNLNFDDNELQIKGQTTWDPTSYLNVWIAPGIEGLGYAYLPTVQSLPARNEDGVVILTEGFGGPNTGAEAPFDLGRTLTHEVGHYLGLDHIWGEGCSVDDGISDTPQQREENYGCPNHPSPSCGNQGDMFMNYMDYTDDHCLNAFTTGQATYMRRILSTSRAALVRPGRSSCLSDPGNPDVPTCSDGIKNGLETGVDCGGPNCKPCNISDNYGDAGISAVRQSTSDDCSGSIVLFATLQNYGRTTLNRVRITVSEGTRRISSYDWTGTLYIDSKVEVTLPVINLKKGDHTLLIATEQPNGGADVNNHNDGRSISVTGGGGNQLRLVIQPDEYASDISWLIRDEFGIKVASGGGYKDGRTELITEEICLPDGCYRLIVRDAYGDGLCCDYGEGWYELRNQNGQVLVASDGYYGYRETQWFCQEGTSFSRQKVERDVRKNVSGDARQLKLAASKSLE